MGYELALDYLEQKGDTKTLETLRRNGPPPYTARMWWGALCGLPGYFE
jgi:hypothetical protein